MNTTYSIKDRKLLAVHSVTLMGRGKASNQEWPFPLNFRVAAYLPCKCEMRGLVSFVCPEGFQPFGGRILPGYVRKRAGRKELQEC